MRRATDPRLASGLAVVSGIPAGDSGTGRFVAHLRTRATELVGRRIRIVSKPERPAPWQIRIWLRNREYKFAAWEVIRYFLLLCRFWWGLSWVKLKRGSRLVLLHPQNLGYRLALRLLESRKEPSLIYLLDSSFFCLRSYNHLQGENGPCLRCLELGFEQVAKNGCTPFPLSDPAASAFAPRLKQLVISGRAKVVAQNARQAELAQAHFGLSSSPPVIGLWTQDWDDVIFGELERPWNHRCADFQWDVLFHGYCLHAKGAGWTAELATHCPDLRFMFPFPKPDWFQAPPNCSFVPCSWESGLRAELGRSRFVIVPSLWSAPIEGALVKSIACARAVVVVNNATSFCSELPEGLTLRLPVTPKAAAGILMQAMEDDWCPDASVRAAWLARFAETKRSFVPELLRAALNA